MMEQYQHVCLVCYCEFYKPSITLNTESGCLSYNFALSDEVWVIAACIDVHLNINDLSYVLL